MSEYKKFWWKGHEFLFNGETADGVDSVAAVMGELHPTLGFWQKCDSHDEHDKYAAADRILEMYPRWIEQWEEENQTCAECGQSLENHKIGRTVHIMGLTQPEPPGAVIAWRCPECKVTEILFDPHAKKPDDGGEFYMVTIECMKHVKWPELPIVPPEIWAFPQSLQYVTELITGGKWR